MTTILFGSISTVADTSEIQRQAFNQAFESHGLDWHWDREDYRSRLGRAGGRERIEQYAAARGETVDAEAVHATKSETFRRLLAADPPPPRPGVLDTLRAARQAGEKVGLVTTTAKENVAALLGALDLTTSDFDVVVDATDVDTPKPDPAAYGYALAVLDAAPGSCVAIEDNPDGVRAADAAGITCLAFPNENTADQEFPGAAARVDRLDPAELRAPR